MRGASCIFNKNHSPKWMLNWMFMFAENGWWYCVIEIIILYSFLFKWKVLGKKNIDICYQNSAQLSRFSVICIQGYVKVSYDNIIVYVPDLEEGNYKQAFSPKKMFRKIQFEIEKSHSTWAFISNTGLTCVTFGGYTNLHT